MENNKLWIIIGVVIVLMISMQGTEDKKEGEFKKMAERYYTGEHWDTSAQSNSPTGIATDGNYIWVVDYINDEIYKYSMAGAYTGEHWDTSVQTDYPNALTTDGINIWVLYTTVYKYSMDGTYIDSWNANALPESVYPYAITTDGNYIWVADVITDGVYKYSMAGVYTGESWYITSQGSDIRGLATDGNYIWVADEITTEIYKYSMAGVYTGEHWDTSIQGDYTSGIATDGNYIWVVDYGDAVFKYENSAIIVDCPTLESNAFDSITSWVTEPVEANKATKRATAVTTITEWITTC